MERITASLSIITRELTAQAQGYKQVFLRNSDTPTTITQVAYGEIYATDYCDLYANETMEE